MQARVTAIIVARHGAGYLEHTLAALSAQTRRPDSLVGVDLSGSADLFLEHSPAHVVTASGRTSFGAAVGEALRVLPAEESADEWLWLLAADSAPAPDALAALLHAVEIAPSVAIAGPKAMRWDDPRTIARFGESLTRLGASVQLVSNELDQAQHDRTSDLLGVAPEGMLVRRSVLVALGGFDPGLPTADAGLDLGVRARLAGHRVAAVPAARIATDSPPPRFAAVRAAQLHRRLVYAPAAAVPLHWLLLLPIAVLRAFVQAAAKHPGRIGGELGAALGAAFDTSVAPARARLARTRVASWEAIAPLRVQPSQARELAANRAAAATATGEPVAPRPGFFSAGGAWTVILLAAIGIASFGGYLNATALAGGGLAPLSGSLGELWSNPLTADPFSWVLAVLGTLTFWSPSTSVIALYLLALPLAALSAWACAARFSTRGWAPAVAAVLWALAPPYLAALHGGHLGAAIAHLLLPWLVLAIVNAARSWSAAGAAALLFAAVVASAPVLGPVLVIGWLAFAIANARSLHRTVIIPLPAAVLFAPLVVAQLGRGTPLALLAEPGVVAVTSPASGWQLALGSPTGGANGWAAVTAALGLSEGLTLVIVAALLAPLAALALLAIFLPGSRRAVPLLALSLLGFITAVASAHLEVSHAGAVTTPIWPGAGLSLYWLGLVGAAVMALEALAKAVLVPALLAIVAAVAVAAPLLAAPVLGLTDVRETNGRMLPAFVTAQASTRPDIGTLVLRAQPSGGVAAQLQHGAGTALDEQSTLTATETEIADEGLATLTANLAARSGLDIAPALAEQGVSFVLLAPVAEDATSEQRAARLRAADALDSSDLFVAIGDTDHGYLWRVAVDTVDVPRQPASLPFGILLAVVFGLAAILAVPTGARRRPVAVNEDAENPADTFEEDENA